MGMKAFRHSGARRGREPGIHKPLLRCWRDRTIRNIQWLWIRARRHSASQTRVNAL